MFNVMGYSGGVAVPPLAEYFEGVGHLPVNQLPEGSVDPGFFEDFAARGIDQCFAAFAATRHRLPKPWVGGSFQQEHVKGRRVNDDQNGNRLFVAGGHASASIGMPRAGASISIQKGVCAFRLSSAAACKTSIKVAKSAGCDARKRVMPLMNRT